MGRKLDDEALYTFAVEAQGVVNSRPLTYLPLDNEEDEALTPNNFLLGSSSGVKQPSREPTEQIGALKNTWNQIETQLDAFWRRWVREFLLTLTRRTKWFADVKPVSQGDLVIIVNDSKRNGWVRGRVLKVITGVDGRVRRAIVQSSKGLSSQSVGRLAVLDVKQEGNTDPDSIRGQCYEGEDVVTGDTARSAPMRRLVTEPKTTT